MVTRVVPDGKKKVLIPANIRRAKSFGHRFSQINTGHFIKSAADFVDERGLSVQMKISKIQLRRHFFAMLAKP